VVLVAVLADMMVLAAPAVLAQIHKLLAEVQLVLEVLVEVVALVLMFIMVMLMQVAVAV
jgi:hypothetical protein